MFDLRVPETLAAIPSRIINPLGPADQGDVICKWTSKANGSPKCQMTVEQAFNQAARAFAMGGWGRFGKAGSSRTLFINRAGKLKWDRPGEPVQVRDGTFGITIIGKFGRDCDLLEILRAIRARQNYFLEA